jgi:hypothetical protein
MLETLCSNPKKWGPQPPDGLAAMKPLNPKSVITFASQRIKPQDWNRWKEEQKVGKMRSEICQIGRDLLEISVAQVAANSENRGLQQEAITFD